MDSARLLWLLSTTVLFSLSPSCTTLSLRCPVSLAWEETTCSFCRLTELLLNKEWWISAVLLLVPIWNIPSAAHALIPSCFPLYAHSPLPTQTHTHTLIGTVHGTKPGKKTPKPSDGRRGCPCNGPGCPSSTRPCACFPPWGLVLARHQEHSDRDKCWEKVRLHRTIDVWEQRRKKRGRKKKHFPYSSQ